MTNTQETQEDEEFELFAKPKGEWGLREYEEDTQTLAQYGLQRVNQREAIGMVYIGSLDENIELNGTEAYWKFDGLLKLSTRFRDRLEVLKRSRPEPTHYSLDVKLVHSWSNCERRYRAIANFYRKNDGEIEDKSR